VSSLTDVSHVAPTLYATPRRFRRVSLSPPTTGNVLRIVIFMKNGVQAMVEFDNEVSAGEALKALDGRDIYAGTCTLQICFSRSETLNVKENDERNRDYTNPSLPSSLVQLPAFGMHQVAGNLYTRLHLFIVDAHRSITTPTRRSSLRHTRFILTDFFFFLVVVRVVFRSRRARHTPTSLDAKCYKYAYTRVTLF
jgi:hypothetical protein